MRPTLLRTLALVWTCFVSSALSFAQLHTITGKIFDKTDGEPLIGATVQLEGTDLYGVTGLDGSYVIRQVPTGDHEMVVKFISFETIRERVQVSGNLVQNFTMEMASHALSEFEVVAKKDEDTEASARLTERTVMNVVNVISAREIEVSPDLTVANVVQRVSGISLERNSNGDGQHAIVRGMDKRYNYTLVNGIKIPSPDPRNRYVPLDIFPSDLLERLEVTKALTPNMEGDAIGGVMDLKMKSAPNRFILNVNVGTGYNQLYFNDPYRSFDRSTTPRLSPRLANPAGYLASTSDFQLENIDFTDVRPEPNQVYGLSIGNRFFGGKLGILAAGSYQNTYRGSNSLFMSTFTDQETNTPYYEIVQVRKFSAQQERMGAHLKVDYQISKDHRIDLYAATIGLNDMETRTRVDTILKIGRGQGPGTGRIELRERSRQRFQRIHNGTLQGRHQIHPKLKADWSAVYSLATNDDPDMAQLQWITARTRNEQGEIVQDPVMYGTDYRRRWMNNSDKDLAGYANLTYSASALGVPIDVSAGGMYRHKNRASSFDDYLLRTMPIMQEWTGNIYDGSWVLFNSIGTPTDPLNYACQEDVAAAYGMVKVELQKLEVLTGARVESTDFTWESNAPPTVKGRTGSIAYMDVLPSVHFKYKLSALANVRLSYFSSISRPSFYEVIPYEVNEEDFRERGNPFLKRTSANNFDLRYERYPSFLDKFMVGAFYKNILDPIESALVIQGQNVFQQPNNFGTAQNMGVEVDLTKYYRNFGVRAFYTYTNSSITTTKIVRFRDEEGNLTSRQGSQTRPLQGQSAHISNVSLLYKNQQSGSDVQLSAVYTGDRIISVSPYLDNDIWQVAFVQLDLSVEQKLGKGFTVYAKINNILDSPLRAEIRLPNTFNPEQAPYLDATENTTVREDFYGQTYFLGLRYQLSK